MNFNDINIKYGDNILYKNYNIHIKDNEITAIIGISGIGKTSLLNEISKRLLIEEIEFSYVFQDYRLIPWKTVKENLEFIFDDKCVVQIDEALKIVDLYDSKYKYPNQLSGGMKQRVNIARAILKPGKIIILDEPFKSIDINRKNKIIKYLKTYINNNNLTCLFVTHDIEEAKIMADNIVEIT